MALGPLRVSLIVRPINLPSLGSALLTLLYLLIPPYLLLWVTGFGMGFLYKRRLRRLFPELAAGRHPEWPGANVSSGLRGAKFLLRREFRRLDDPAFVRFCEWYRGVMLLFFAVFSTVAVVFFSIWIPAFLSSPR